MASDESVGTDKYVIRKAEILRSQLIRNGYTVDIRVLEDFVVDNNVRVPKGTIIYGVAEFDPGNFRLNVTVNKFLIDGHQRSGAVTVLDYDGRNGIHLNENIIYDIPAEVVKEVAQAMRIRYQNPPPALGGNDNGRPSNQEIATITAMEQTLKHLNRVETRLPAGYVLWLKVAQKKKKKRN